MILGSMANFVMAGTTFLYIKSGKDYLATNWDIIVAKVSDCVALAFEVGRLRPACMFTFLSHDLLMSL